MGFFLLRSRKIDRIKRVVALSFDNIGFAKKFVRSVKIGVKLRRWSCRSATCLNDSRDSLKLFALAKWLNCIGRRCLSKCFLFTTRRKRSLKLMDWIEIGFAICRAQK